MKSLLQKIRTQPILILLAINILVGLLTFRDYGLSWDEPLFYDYASALGYAYSPQAWLSGHFDLNNAYGASGTDHANRGPAYLLLARGPVAGLRFVGLDSASAWHLINFLTFQLGIYFFYRLARRYVDQWPALAAAAFFAWQPLLWGHAFINPKDPPFLVFFLGAMLFGFEFVDSFAEDSLRKNWKLITAAFLLGIATSIRVLGPLAGLLIAIYAVSKVRGGARYMWLRAFAVYFGIAALVAFASWPYLWTSPLANFLDAFGFMSDNPTQLIVLFNGNLYHANELPRRYFPELIAITLTEPVWPLLIVGALVAGLRSSREKLLEYVLIALWFLIPFAYALVLKPPMYDGFRHFLFVLPPIFLFIAIALNQFAQLLRGRWVAAMAFTVLLLPGLLGIFQLHPYEYAYYNSLVGGTAGAFRRFETDYWLTCYKESVERFQAQFPGEATIYVNREAYIAAAYANKNLTALERRGAANEIRTGDFVLINTRSNEDLKISRDAPTILEVGRGGATFCVIKRVP